MPTGQVVCTGALMKLGLVEPDGTAGASDTSTTLRELNNMWSSWSIDEGLIYAIQVFVGALVTATAGYTIGTGATFNTPRPARIYKAFFVLGANRNELTLVDARRYYDHNDLTASAATPDEMYADFLPDPTTGYAKVYLWPVPTFGAGSPTLEIQQAVNFATWVLGTNYQIPPGYQDDIEWTLAFRMLSYFGAAVNPAVAETVAMQAAKGELRLRRANAINRQIPEPLMAAPGSQAAPPAGA